MLNELIEYLSTDLRKKVFFSYAFRPRSQSEVVNTIGEKKISSVDRITFELTLMKYLIKSTKENSSVQIYQLNWEFFIQEALAIFNLKIQEEELKKFKEFLIKPEVISFYFYIIQKKILKLILNKSNKQIKQSPEEIARKLMQQYILEKGLNPAEYPLFFIIWADPISNLLKNKKDDKSKDFWENFFTLVGEIYNEEKILGLSLLKKEDILKIVEDMEEIKKIIQTARIKALETEIDSLKKKEGDEIEKD